MEPSAETVIHYLLGALGATGIQLAILLGPLVILSVLMHFVSQLVRNAGLRVFGWKGFVYGFKWLGTPLHEFGHLLFAWVFGHRIKAVKLFDPKAKDGSFGYVKHTYNTRNIYQQSGRFFIGIGPLLIGALVLFIGFRILFGIGYEGFTGFRITENSFSSISTLVETGKGILSGLLSLLKQVVAGPSASWWKLMIFIFLLFSIGGSMTLSPEDIRGAFAGFLLLVVALLIFNLATLWIGGFLLESLTGISGYMSGLYLLMIISILINLLFALLLGLSLLLTGR